MTAHAPEEQASPVMQSLLSRGQITWGIVGAGGGEPDTGGKLVGAIYEGDMVAGWQ